MNYLSARQIAGLLSVSKSTALGIMHEAGAIRFGRNLRLSVEDFDKWRAAKKTQTVSFDEVASIIVGSAASGKARGVVRARQRSRSVTGSKGQPSIPFTGPRSSRRSGSAPQ